MFLFHARRTFLFAFLFSLSLFSPAIALRPHAVIHITTSPSSLDGNFALNRELFQQKGYPVLMHGAESAIFVHTLASLNDEKAKSGLFNTTVLNSFIDTISNQKGPFILSSEEFGNLGLTSVIALGKMLRDYDVTVVAYHRERTQHLRSMWYDSNKLEHSPASFSQWSNTFIPLAYSSPSSFDLLAVLDRYASVFGEESIRLISFEGALAHSNPLFVFVKDILKLSLGSFRSRAEKKNLIPSNFEINFIALTSHSSDSNCVSPTELEKLKSTAKLKIIPQTCVKYSGWQSLFDREDKDIFLKYGEPLYLSKDPISPLTDCKPDIPAIVSDPKISKAFDQLIESLCHKT